MRNSEGYFDPTAGIAERNIEREERRKFLMSTIKRGDIYYIEYSDRYVGSEQRSGRPAIIVSNDRNNQTSSTVEVVYLTTQPKNNLPTHVCVKGTGRESTALCEQVTTVALERVRDYCGSCTTDEMKRVDAAILASLGLTRPDAEKATTVTVQKAVDSETEKKLIATEAQLSILQQMYADLLQKVTAK